MKNAKTIGAIAIIIAASLWAVDGILIRPHLHHLDVSAVVFMEHFIAFILMSLFLVPSFLKQIKNIKPKEWASFGLVAIFGGILGTYGITQAIFYVFEHGASISAILLLQKLQPVFAIFLAILLLKEKPAKSFFYWALIAITGSYILTFGYSSPNIFFDNPNTMAALFSLVAAFSWGASTVFSKMAITNISFKIATYIRFALTSAIMAALIIFFNKTETLTHFTGNDMILMLIIAFTTGGAAIFIYYYGLKRVKASSSTIYELAFPVTAITAEYIFHGKFMGLDKLSGALILCFAIVMIVRNNNRRSNS